MRFEIFIGLQSKYVFWRRKDGMEKLSNK